MDGEERRWRKHSGKKGKVFSFPERLDGVLNIVSWRMYTERGNPLFSFRCVQLKLRWETQTIYTRGHLLFCLFLYKKKRERGGKTTISERCKRHLCNISITISVSFFFFFFFSRYYSCHPCFLSYCSISECCRLVYGLDMCERRRCESQ